MSRSSPRPRHEPCRDAHAVRITAVLKQAWGGRRYGAEFKRAVVEYALPHQGERATIREITEELGLSAGSSASGCALRGYGSTRAGCRSHRGESPATPWLDPHEPAAPSASSGSMARCQAAASQCIVIPAASLAEFLSRAVARYGSIRLAATGIGIPYSTLRGRCGDASDHGNAFLDAVTALRGDLKAMSQRLDALEQMLGCESGARDQA